MTTTRRPTLAYKLVPGVDRPPLHRYDEARQLSLVDDGQLAVVFGGARIETFAERDRPDPPGTETRAAQDPGDAHNAWMAEHANALAAGEGRRDGLEPMETVTKAARDPGDMQDAGIAALVTALLTEARRDRDDDDPEPEPSSPDDLVTGVVAF